MWIQSSEVHVTVLVLVYLFFFAFCLYSCSGRSASALQLCAVKTQQIEADFDCLENLSGVSFVASRDAFELLCIPYIGAFLVEPRLITVIAYWA